MDARMRVRALPFGAALLALGFSANAQQVVNQTLDTVQVFGSGRVLERVDDPATTGVDYRYVDTGLAGTTLTAAQLTATQGLFALDGNWVVQWSDTEDPASRRQLFSCAQVPGLDDRLAQACTGLTADLTGNVLWLAGRNKGRTHNLVKVVRSTAGQLCPTSWQAIGSTAYFACTWVTGRPLLIDITVVDGSAAETLNPSCTAATCAKGAGVLGLEERRRAVFFPTTNISTVPIGQSVEIASGKTGWGLSGSEQLLGATLFQAGGVSYVLATTSSSRILRSTTDGSSSVVALGLDVPLADSSCTSRSPQYGIRSSAKSGLVYVTDRDCRRARAFAPSSTTTPLTALTQSEDLPTGSVAPEGPTVAAGRAYSLLDYSGQQDRPLLTNLDGDPSLELSKVTLVDRSVSGLVLFQIQNIPDCRWIPPARWPDVCGRAGVIDGAALPASEQRLNVTPLLPKEVTDLFAPGQLPPLYVQAHWRGQAQNDYYFEAMFALTEPGVYFTGTFDLHFYVARLTRPKRELGCIPEPPATSVAPFTPLATLLAWDVTTKVSENFISVGDPISFDDAVPGGYDYEDTLINIGCGSIRSGGSRASLIPYNLAMAPNLAKPSASGGFDYAYTDTVYKELLDGLYDELYQATADLACRQVDGGTATPLLPADCSSLKAAWFNGRDKLNKCFQATTQPKQSAGDQNCQAFDSQLSNFRASLLAAPACGADLSKCDPANRRGELLTRLNTISHVFRDRFLPSIPPDGFCNCEVLPAVLPKN
jgi:hypothetical protein